MQRNVVIQQSKLTVSFLIDDFDILMFADKGMFLAAGDDTGGISVVDLKPLRQGR
jgi:hypothetical protein